MNSRKRRVPLRTCVVCGTKADKRSLLRLVVAPDGKAYVDRSGKMNGRGTYVCLRDADCPVGDLKRRKVEWALKTLIGPEAWQMLMASTASERASATVT